jgi:hypothetical protein
MGASRAPIQIATEISTREMVQDDSQFATGIRTDQFSSSDARRPLRKLGTDVEPDEVAQSRPNPVDFVGWATKWVPASRRRSPVAGHRIGVGPLIARRWTVIDGVRVACKTTR